METTREPLRIALREIAHSRAGDKGNISNLSLIAYDLSDYALLVHYVTPALVQDHFADLGVQRIERYALPQLGALNFVLHGALAGGVTRSLALDAHGKSLSSALLSLEIPGSLPVNPEGPDQSDQ